MAYTSASILGPLTTTFTPPPLCGTLEVSTDIDKSGYVGFWGTGCNPSPTRGAHSCLPASFATYLADHIDGDPVYSPAWACPSGWGAACSFAKHDGQKPPMIMSTDDYRGIASNVLWNAMKNAETLVGCCPGGYSCDGPSFCRSEFTPGDILTLPSFSDSCVVVTSTITIPPNQAPDAISAFRINVIVPSGRTITSIAAPTPTSKHSATTTPKQQPQPTTMTTSDVSSSTGSVRSQGSNTTPGGQQIFDAHDSGNVQSPSQAVIISVSIIIPVILVAAAIAAIYFIRIRKQKKKVAQRPESQTQDYLKAELDASKSVTAATGPVLAYVAEMSADSAHELAASPVNRSELDSQGMTAMRELSADRWS
ncbi:hypothetical protein NLG97_g4082 [Lecanicillium saksenae]|uniref:Uncharacterized protein n=1 Tax=Lecanicillium saksenae TaxID=468837 RepID=A0ACC1QYY2_9HYPO|nr:hypothetical protein NLG97_g4082 [Lecanicillium saksenae]